MAGDQEDKEFAPSAQRLERARKDGDAIRSEELQAAVAMTALALACAGLGPILLDRLAGMALQFLAFPERISPAAPEILSPVYQMIGLGLALVLAPAVAVLLWLTLSRAISFVPGKLELKWSRLSPLANARQKFGVSGLADFCRRALKMLLVAGMLGVFLRQTVDDLYLGPWLSEGQVVLLMSERLMGFLWLVAGAGLVLGAVDLFWQWRQFQQRNRMTRKELTDEMKESEGDPHQKADRRRRAVEIANRQMMVEVPKADVVIVNPTHYAVALRWNRRAGGAPVCIAKGVDEVAAKIRDLAAAAAVPIHADPPTARLLYATLEPGQEIRREHYAAVAAAIRFADAMRVKAGRKVWR